MIKLVALCGKAGAGKDTVLRRIMELYPEKFNEIVSCTTRPPREGEREGVNYYFLTTEQFGEKIINGDMLECTVFRNWHYGTMLSSLSRDKVNIGVFNPAGIACLAEDKKVDLSVYWIDAPDRDRLVRQLLRENDPDIEEIFRRYKTDEEDFLDMDDFDYTLLKNVTKEDLETCATLIERWTD